MDWAALRLPAVWHSARVVWFSKKEQISTFITPGPLPKFYTNEVLHPLSSSPGISYTTEFRRVSAQHYCVTDLQSLQNDSIRADLCQSTCERSPSAHSLYIFTYLSISFKINTVRHNYTSSSTTGTLWPQLFKLTTPYISKRFISEWNTWLVFG